METINDSTTISLIESFGRQRRNLLLISIFLLLFEIAGISEISHEQNLFGVNFVIERPYVIPIFLWVIFFYFTIRYAQAWHELGLAPGFLYNHKFLEEELKTYANKIAPALDEAKRLAVKDGKVLKSANPDVIRLLNHGDRFYVVELSYNIELLDEGDRAIHHTNTGEFRRTIKGRDFLIIKYKTFLKTYFYTNVFTEYFFPPLFALSIIIFKMYSSVS